MASTKLEVVIAGDTRSLERSLARADKATDRFGKNADRTGKRVGGAFGGIGKAAAGAGALLAGAGLVSGLRDIASAAAESEKSQAKLTAQLRASGISYKAHGKEIDAVIAKTSRLAALDDEDLSDAFTNLVRATGSVDKSMRGLGIAADLARAKNIDVSKAGELVGKVYAGNTGALARYGIKLKEGSTATQAIAELQKRFAGQAKAYGETSAGAFDRFSVASENLKEAIGAKLAPALANISNAAARFLESDALPKAFERVKSTVGPVISSITGLVRGFRDGKAGSTALVGGLAAVAAGFAAFKIVTTVTKALAAAKVAMIALNVALRANPIGLVISAVAALGVAFVTAYKKSETFRRIVDGVFGALKSAAREGVQFVLGVFDKLLGGYSTIASAAGKLPGPLGSPFRKAADAINGARDKLRDFSKSLDATPKKKTVRLDVEIKPQILSGVDAVAQGIRKAAKNVGDPAGAYSGAAAGATAGLAAVAKTGLSQILGRFGGVRVSSGYRSPAQNAAAGGAEGSDHLWGGALDLVPPEGWTKSAVGRFDRIAAWAKRQPFIRWVGWRGEPGHGPGNHLHLSFVRAKGIGRDKGDPKGAYTKGDLMDLWEQAGGPAGSANLAAAVALAESRGRPNATNRNSDGSIDRGLWQINSVHGALSTTSVRGNASAAVKISNRGRNWSPWVTYKTGAYKQFLRAPARRSGKAGKTKKLTSTLGLVTAGPKTTAGGQAQEDRRVEQTTNAEYAYQFDQNQAANAASASGDSAPAPTVTDTLNAQFGGAFKAADVNAALAALTPGTADDLAAATYRRDAAQQAFNAALASGDADATIEFAGVLKAATDAVESLTGEIAQQRQLDQKRLELDQALVENQRRFLQLADQSDAILTGTVAAISGSIGGRVGLGFSTPSFAGGFARY